MLMLSSFLYLCQFLNRFLFLLISIIMIIGSLDHIHTNDMNVTCPPIGILLFIPHFKGCPIYENILFTLVHWNLFLFFFDWMIDWSMDHHTIWYSIWDWSFFKKKIIYSSSTSRTSSLMMMTIIYSIHWIIISWMVIGLIQFIRYHHYSLNWTCIGQIIDNIINIHLSISLFHSFAVFFFVVCDEWMNL